MGSKILSKFFFRFLEISSLVKKSAFSTFDFVAKICKICKICVKFVKFVKFEKFVWVEGSL